MSYSLLSNPSTGSLRNDFTGLVGFGFTVGSSNLIVTKLGKWMVSGNSGTHTVKLANQSDGSDVSGGSVSINLSGKTPGQYIYAALAAPITLTAGASYYLFSDETNLGDQWYNVQAVVGSPDINSIGEAYHDTTYHLNANSGQSYDGVTFIYWYDIPKILAEGLANGSNEITFTPVSGASKHTIQSATSSGGTYGTLGTVTSGNPSVFNDASPSSPVFYRVFATVGGIDQSPTAGIAPTPVSGTGMSDSTISAASPTTRVNLLNDSGNSLVSVLENATFVEQSAAYTFGGPYSPFVIAHETFASGLGGLTNFAAGTGTTTVSGSLAYSASSQTTAAWMESAQYVSPQFCIGVVVSAISNAIIGMGLMGDLRNGVSLEYDSGANTLKIIGISGGTPTTLKTVTGFTPGTAFSIAFECLHNIFNIWADTGSGFAMVDGVMLTDFSTFDMRNPTYLSTWYPTYYVLGSSAGAFNATITDFKATYFNGPGGTRECAPVTQIDGSFYTKDGLYWLALDRSTRPRSTNQFASTSFQIHPYDPKTKTIYAPIVNICGTFSGTPAAAADAKIVYDINLDGFHIYTPNWSVIGTSFVTALYYAFVPSAQFTGIVNPAYTALTVPSDTSNVLYGPDVIYIAPYWYLVATEFVSSGTHFYSRIIRGSTATNFDTNIAIDTASDNEGTSFLRIGSKVYVIAGSFLGQQVGFVTFYDFSDLTNLTRRGFLDVPNLNTTTKQPQQPAVLWYDDGSGNGVMQLLNYIDDNYQGEYQASGSFMITEATQKLSGWQFPLRGTKKTRTSEVLPNRTTHVNSTHTTHIIP